MKLSYGYSGNKHFLGPFSLISLVNTVWIKMIRKLMSGDGEVVTILPRVLTHYFTGSLLIYVLTPSECGVGTSHSLSISGKNHDYILSEVPRYSYIYCMSNGTLLTIHRTFPRQSTKIEASIDK